MSNTHSNFTKDDCLFCQTKNIAATLLAETKYFRIVADISPVTRGHLLIMPKRHMVTFFELNAEEFTDLQTAILQAKELSHSEELKKLYQKVVADSTTNARTRQAYQKALDNWKYPVTGYNLKVNNGVSAGQQVPHLHVHLVPRYQTDGSNF